LVVRISSSGFWLLSILLKIDIQPRLLVLVVLPATAV